VDLATPSLKRRVKLGHPGFDTWIFFFVFFPVLILSQNT